MTLQEAKINYLKVLEEVSKDKTFEWAMNEMSEEINEKFFGAIYSILELIPD